MRERKKARVSKTIKALVLSLALVAGTVTSVGNVFATSNNCLWTIAVSEGFDMGDSNANLEIQFKDNNNQNVGSAIAGSVSKTNTSVQNGQMIPDGATKVTVRVQDAGKGLKTASVKLAADGEEQINNTNKAQLDTGITFDLLTQKYVKIEMEIGAGSSEQEYTWDPTDPTIWFVWGTEGEENSFFKYQITGIPTDKSMKEVEVADVKDGTTQFDLSKQERVTPDGPEKAYEFVYSSAMTHALADVNFTNASTSEKFRYLRDHRMTVDPVGSSPASANAIHCAGAYAFNVLILNKDEYKPIEVVSGGEKYKSEYDSELIQSGLYDLGGTSQANPGKFETFLLEDTVKIKGSAQMGQITNISIMGVSNNAVTATSVDGVWTIKFNSNFYDEVTMEVELQNGEKGYVTIIRKDVAIKEFWPGSTAPASMKSKSYVEFCYPSTDSYKDYKVVLTCVAADGSKVTHTLDTPNKGLEMGNGDYYDGYELPPDGTHVVGVKKAWYALPDGVTASAYSNIYVNVVKNLENEATSFGGTLLGHGLGLEFKSNGHGFDRVLSNGQVIR